MVSLYSRISPEEYYSESCVKDMSKGSPRISIRLPYDIINFVNGQAQEKKVTPSVWIRELILKEKARIDAENMQVDSSDQ